MEFLTHELLRYKGEQEERNLYLQATMHYFLNYIRILLITTFLRFSEDFLPLFGDLRRSSTNCPKVTQVFPNISEKFSKKSEDAETFEDDSKMFRSYINKLRSNKRVKREFTSCNPSNIFARAIFV